VIDSEHRLVAVSSDIDRVEKFRMDNQDHTSAIVKVKRKCLDQSIIDDLELVRYGDSYVPAQYYRSVKDLSMDRDNDLQYAVEVIMREVSDKHREINDRDARILIRAAMILNEMIESGEVPDLPTLKELKNMDTAYHGAIT
jgi:hypothetical protein